MTAVAIDRAALIREAHAVLHVAIGTREPRHPAVEAAMVSLGEALEIRSGIDGGSLHWECAFPELRDEADPEGEAARKAADEVEAAAEDLIKVMAAYCGTEDEMTNPGVGK